VTVIEMTSQLLPGVDKEISQVLLRSMKKRKVAIYTDSKALRVEKSGVESRPAQLIVQTPKGEITLDADKILMSVGREPNSENLGLVKANVKTGEKGFIQVDKQLRTSNPNIFAIGDVTAPPLLAHKASKEATIAADIIAGRNVVVDYRALPAAIFTRRPDGPYR
jgi:dihydrolipoamide dehydrogenase